MSHMMSAAQMKGRSSGCPLDEPTPGSRIRRLWDRLYENRGLVIELIDLGYPGASYLASDIRRLQDTYGFDIRVRRRSWGRGGGERNALYCLVGEWKGDKYVDYVAEHHADVNSP